MCNGDMSEKILLYANWFYRQNDGQRSFQVHLGFVWSKKKEKKGLGETVPLDCVFWKQSQRSDSTGETFAGTAES